MQKADLDALEAWLRREDCDDRIRAALPALIAELRALRETVAVATANYPPFADLAAEIGAKWGVEI